MCLRQIRGRNLCPWLASVPVLTLSFPVKNYSFTSCEAYIWKFLKQTIKTPDIFFHYYSIHLWLLWEIFMIRKKRRNIQEVRKHLKLTSQRQILPFLINRLVENRFLCSLKSLTNKSPSFPYISHFSIWNSAANLLVKDSSSGTGPA